jgi:hypothetical protein
MGFRLAPDWFSLVLAVAFSAEVVDRSILAASLYISRA